MVTEASSQVYGMDARDGYIKARIKSREMTPSFKSKQHFRSNRVRLGLNYF